MNNRHKKSGFTLIELLVVLAVVFTAAIVIVVAIAAAIYYSKIWTFLLT